MTGLTIHPRVITTTVRMHRWVIGKEGSFIKQLEERSKAAVRISDSESKEFGRSWKYVGLQGTPRAVDRAKSEWVGGWGYGCEMGRC